MNTTIMNKTASTGQVIEIKLKEYLPGQHIAQLFLDGQYVFGESKPVPLAMPRGEVTHWIGGNRGKVGLTAAEAALIVAAIQGADAMTLRTQTGSELLTPAEESDLQARIQRCRPASAAQIWQGQASMDPEDSHF